MGTISRINYMCKKQCYVRSLKFGNRQNNIDYLICTGVECIPNNLSINDNTGNSHEVTQLEISFEDPTADKDNDIDSVDNQDLDLEEVTGVED